MLEPSITVTNVDETFNLAVDPVDNRLNILCPVISPSGPLELTRVTGPSELKRLFFGGKNITANDETSAIFARALSAEAPIWIKRGARNTMRGGISSASGDRVYVDENLLPVTGLEVTVDPPEITTVQESFDTWVADKTGVVRVDNVVYTSENMTGDWVKANSKPAKNLNTKISITAPLIGDVTLYIGDFTFTIAEGSSDFDSIMPTLISNKMFPQKFEASEESEVKNILDDTSIPTGITSLSWIAPLTVSAIYFDKNDESNFLISTDITSNGTINCYTLKTEQENADEWKLAENPCIDVTVVGGTTYAYYCGTYEGTSTVKNRLMTNATPTYKEFMSALIHDLAVDFHAGTSSESSIILPSATGVTGTSIDVSTSNINDVVDSEKFAIVSRFPSTTPVITAKLSEDEGIYRLQVSYADISETWNFAFDASLVDGYGNSLYYDRVNNNSELVYIVELNGEATSSGLSKVFGNEVTSDYSDVNDIISALESIAENEEAESYFDYIVDAGIVNTTLSSTIQNLCAKYYSFYPASCPSELTADSAISRRSALGSNWQTNFIAQTQRDTRVDSGSVILPASFYYTNRRIELGNTAQEFIALFGSNQGGINMENPLQKWTKTQRESFLDYQIPTLKRDPSSGYYINDNMTCYSTASYLQEDGIALMVNKINQVADAYAKTLISKYHTRALESQVVNELTLQLRNRMRVGTDNGPLSITVICDASNNPQSLINQRKIRIDVKASFTRSIRDVVVFSTIQSTAE